MKPFLYTNKEQTSILKLLSRAAEPEEAMNAVEFHGFCYGLAILPEIIRMDEWMPIAFGEERVVFENEADANELIGAMFAFQNRLVGEMNAGTLRFPFDYPARGSWSMEEVEDWAYGLDVALHLRPAVWEMDVEPAPEEDDSPKGVTQLSLSLVIIMAVAYPEQIPELFNRTAFDPETNEEDTKFYASLFAVLPEAVEIVREHSASQKKTFPGGMPLSPRPGAPTQARIGRNDPCPCGSGKKYKKCCLMNH